VGLPYRKAALVAAFFSFGLSACGTVPPEVRLEEARALGRSAGFSDAAVDAAGFRLFGLLRQGESGDDLRVYIEGDGAPWIRAYQPPDDPTPERPLALGLAARDGGTRVAYLARPCQYLSSRRCEPKFWSTERFSPEVVAAYQSALDQLKSRSGATRLRLVGYSGGGVIAALLAASRPDVAELLTVAAPLDTEAWVRHHDITPLAGENPADRAEGLKSLAQHHWVGGRDEVVPAGVVHGFARRAGRPLAVSEVPGYDHECCWVDDWPRRMAGAGRDR
jgi:pimeloyl-ACP methyl ester carboxylesterase